MIALRKIVLNKSGLFFVLLKIEAKKIKIIRILNLTVNFPINLHIQILSTL